MWTRPLLRVGDTMSNLQPTPIRIIQDAIAGQLGRARPSGFYAFAYCPFCGDRGGAAVKPGSGFKCYSCEREVKTLEDWQDLAATLATPIRLSPKVSAPRQAEQPKLWQHDPMFYHGRYTSAIDLVERWQAYKPVSHDNILRHQLGYGVLPPTARRPDGSLVYTMGCNHKRLIYANIENPERRPVAFRGRQLECTCYKHTPGDLKWLTIAGASAWLWNSAGLASAAGRWIVIAENPIDAMLIGQAMPEVYPVAGTAGAGTWRDEWTRLIVAARPRGVMVWYDNDLIGNPTPETQALMVDRWIAKMIDRGHPPTTEQIQHQRTKAMGPKIAAAVEALGTPARPYAWPAGTRPKYDAGQYLIDIGAV